MGRGKDSSSAGEAIQSSQKERPSNHNHSGLQCDCTLGFWAAPACHRSISGSGRDQPPLLVQMEVVDYRVYSTYWAGHKINPKRDEPPNDTDKVRMSGGGGWWYARDVVNKRRTFRELRKAGLISTLACDDAIELEAWGMARRIRSAWIGSDSATTTYMINPSSAAGINLRH